VRVAIGLALALLGSCRPGAESVVSESGGAVTVRPGPQPDEPRPERPPEELEPSSESDDLSEPNESLPCELACADVYGCLLAGGRTEAEAASIELGCLAACVEASDAFAGCGPLSSSGPQVCAGYLACVRQAWSTKEPPPLIVDPSSDGCSRACGALGGCRGFGIDAIEECARQCRQLHDSELQRLANDCAELESCEAIERCVMALPGA
jgi:hypothetical protein